jgi:hypothetical protein
MAAPHENVGDCFVLAYRAFAYANATELIDVAISSTCCVLRLVKVQLTSSRSNGCIFFGQHGITSLYLHQK